MGDVGGVALLMADPVGFIANPANWWTAATTIATGAFALISWRNQQTAQKKAEYAEAQLRQMQLETLRASLDSQILAWGGEVISALADAERIAASRQHVTTAAEYDVQRRAAMSRISALVDRGRLFFPNVSNDLVGLDRPPAMRGYRPPILDAVLLVHERLNRLDLAGDPTAFAAEVKPMMDARRVFVSELQRALDPRRRQLVLKALAESRDAGDDAVWDEVQTLVDAFEAQHVNPDGSPSFWRERPRPRHVLLAERGLAAEPGGGGA